MKKNKQTDVATIVTQGKMVGVAQCGFCTKKIYSDEEAGGKLRRKDGKPICAMCRIMKGSMGATISEDRERAIEDEKARVAFVEENENERIREVARLSQIETDTRISKE